MITHTVNAVRAAGGGGGGLWGGGGGTRESKGRKESWRQ